MANYNLTNQTISSSFQQLLQKDETTGTLYDGTGSVVSDLDITSSYAVTASYAENVDDPTWDEIQNKPSGLVSGAAQINELLPSGVVSGSSQIDITQTTGNLTSSRIDGIVLSASYAENGGVTSIIAGNNINIDQSTGDVTISSTTTASADWNNLTNKPDGIVSGSSQIDLSQATGVAVSASYAETSSFALNFNPSATASYALTASFLEGSVESAEYANNTIVYGKNMTGTQIEKGTPLYFSGSNTSGNVVGVYPADAGNPDRMPAGGVAGETLTTPGGEGRVFLDGFLNGIDTSAFASGDAVYVGVGGGYTNVKPTGSANLIQALGYVEKSDINGSGVIQGSGRANDVPNISNGYGWFGNSDGVAIAQSTGSFAKTDIPNTFTTEQTIDGTLIISQSAGLTGSIMHFPLTGGSGLQGIASNRFFNVGPNLFEQSYQGIDKYILQTVGSGEIEISSATSMVLNPDTSGVGGQLVSTQIMQQQGTPLSGNGQTNSIAIGAYTGSNGVIYTANTFGIQNYPGSGYNNAFTIGKYNSSFTKISEMRVDEGLVAMTIGDGDANYNQIRIEDNNAGQSVITLQADVIQSTNTTAVNNLNVGVNHPTSQSLFVGDGAQPRIQVLDQVSAAASGVNIELSGNVVSTNLQVTPNSPDSQSLVVDNGAQTVFTVHSQTEQGSNGIHATLNGNVQIANELKLNGNLDMGAAAGGGVINVPNGSTFTNQLYVNTLNNLSGQQINVPAKFHFGSRITSDIQSVSISNFTASIDLSSAQMAEVTLPSSGDVLLDLQNATDGQVFNLLIKQGGSGTTSLPGNILQPSGSDYSPTNGFGSRDILTFSTFDYSSTNEIYLVNVTNLV